jgi:hypothetical protein
VVRGQYLGAIHEQRTPCTWRDYLSGIVPPGGFVFGPVVPGVALTLRASAPGYIAQERTVVPLPGMPTRVVFTLAVDDPAAPPISPDPTVMVLGFVVDSAGRCVEGASVQVVRGQRVGTTVAQTTPCNAWDLTGGFVFRPLAPGVELTLRVSAPGYVASEVTVVPQRGPQSPMSFVLARE